MNSAFIGFAILFGVFHLILIVVPITNTLKAAIAGKSKMFWCLFLTLLPVVGVLIFHFRYKVSLFRGGVHETTAAEERARSGTLASGDHD